MGKFPFFVNGDALGWEQLMPVDRLTNAGGAQAVQSIELDVGGKDMDDMVTIDDRDEKVKDVSFVFLIPFWPSLFCVPLLELLVVVCLPTCRFLPGELHALHALPGPLLTGRVL